VSTLITDASGFCVMHNDVYVQTFNLPRGQEIDGEYRLFDDPQIQAAGHREEIRSVFTRGTHAQFEMKYFIEGRGERQIRFSAFPVYSGREHLRNVVLQHMDITDEVQAVEERERLRNQLFQAQKMESIGTLAGGVAHDYNNLLVGVLGGAELLLKTTDPKDHNHKLLCIIRDSALKMSDLNKSLLAYAQGGKYLPESIDINAFIEETVHFARRIVDKQIDITLDLEDHLPPLMADRGQLHQTLINLLMNGAESISGKGTISLRTRLEPEAVTDETSSEGKTARVRIEVLDTGCGMTGEVMDRIFEPFFSTKGTGRGLGLSATYGITKQHRATIKAESRPGNGTRIEMVWPACETHDAWGQELLGRMDGSAGNQRQDISCAGGCILVVDDEEIVREVARDILLENGYQVISADDGDTAVEIAKTTPHVQLVILDIVMRRLSGKETFQQLKSIRPDLRILLSSGYDQKGPVGEIMSLGADGFIQKPYNMADLLQHVGRFMNPPAGEGSSL